MNRIELYDALPEVFAHRADIKSDVWKTQVAFEKGRKYLVEANSGTGKSSLCSYLYGHRHDYQGRILFDGTDISTFGTSDWTKLRRRHISLLWQELRMFPELTVLENVLIKNRLTGFQKQKRIVEWIDLLGLSAKLHEPLGHISVGERQRVALVRALCQPFDFILLDEPVSHLDDSTGGILARVLLDEAARQGAGIIATSVGRHAELDYDATLRL